jgi:HTH-type transcriptional regulator / antitoxin MqsA
MTDAPLCPETGKPMVRGTRPMTISYKGQSATIDMPGWYCDESGESVHTGEDQKVSDKALKELKIQVENLLKPADVKRIRKEVLNLTQREASAIFGGGINAFQKYESGENLLSHAMSNLLRVLERHPEEAEKLKEENRTIVEYENRVA